MWQISIVYSKSFSFTLIPMQWSLGGRVSWEEVLQDLRNPDFFHHGKLSSSHVASKAEESHMGNYFCGVSLGKQGITSLLHSIGQKWSYSPHLDARRVGEYDFCMFVRIKKLWISKHKILFLWRDKKIKEKKKKSQHYSTNTIFPIGSLIFYDWIKKTKFGCWEQNYHCKPCLAVGEMPVVEDEAHSRWRNGGHRIAMWSSASQRSSLICCLGLLWRVGCGKSWPVILIF